MKVPRAVILACVAGLVATGSAQGQSAPALLNQWGSLGNAPGQFEYPYGVAVASDGSVYVTDQYNYRVEQFGPMGDFIRAWGSSGTGPGQFGLTIGICVAPNGQVYIADYSNRRVQVFTSGGQFVRIFATGVSARDVAVAANGDAYVINSNPSVFGTPVDVFDSNGVFKLEIGGSFLVRAATSLALASDGSLFVSDTWTYPQGNGIWRFDAVSGAYRAFWPMDPLFGPTFAGVHGLSIAPNGDIYLCDYPSAQVGVLSPSGALLGQWVLPSIPGQDVTAADVAVGPDGSVYVVDLLGNRIVHYGYGVTPTRNESWGKLKIAYGEKSSR